MKKEKPSYRKIKFNQEISLSEVLEEAALTLYEKGMDSEMIGKALAEIWLGCPHD